MLLLCIFALIILLRCQDVVTSSCNNTLSGTNGTFQSPNYPSQYPNGQSCSWRIKTTKGHRVLLRFTNFTLQKQNNTDTVQIFDGWNDSSPLIGEFHGGHIPPREGLASSSDVMLVIFKSDAVDAYAGFQAAYDTIPALPETTPPSDTIRAASSPASGGPVLHRVTHSASSAITPPSSRQSNVAIGATLVGISSVALIALLLFGLRLWLEHRKTQKNTITTSQNQAVYSCSRQSAVYATIDANYGKPTENNARYTSGLYEDILDYKSSQNAIYCPFTTGNEYTNLPGAAAHAQDKRSDNPLYNSTDTLVS